MGKKKLYFHFIFLGLCAKQIEMDFVVLTRLINKLYFLQLTRLLNKFKFNKDVV